MSEINNAYKCVVPVRVSGTQNVVLCQSPGLVACDPGDRVIVAGSVDSAKYARIEGIALSAPALVDPDTLKLIEAVNSEQFPLRKLLAKYNIVSFAYENESEVCNA